MRKKLTWGSRCVCISSPSPATVTEMAAVMVVVDVLLLLFVAVVEVVVTVVVMEVDDVLAVVISHPATSIFRKHSGTVYTVLISKKNNLLVSLMVCCVYEFKPLGCWFNSPLLQYLNFQIIIFLT
jgi:hypothetical protein